jgi:hypothetical protein
MEIGPDGEQRIVAVNATDPRDNVSRLQAVRVVRVEPVAATRRDVKRVKAPKKRRAQ